MTDAPRYYYMRSKMNASLHYAVNLIQNATQQNPNPKITSKDLIEILSASMLNQFNARAGNGSYDVSAFVYYIESGNGATTQSSEDNPAKVVWCWHVDSLEASKNNASRCVSSPSGFYNSMINASGRTATDIMNGFKIANGDGKIILEIGFVPKGKNAMKAFGFLAMPVRPTCGSSYFNKAVGFTPRPFLFDETQPASEPAKQEPTTDAEE